MGDWSDWCLFPDPTKKGYLWAPIGPGVYELRLRSTGEFICPGESKNVAARMTSLLPASAGGAGTRKRDVKRECILENIGDIEYRTLACETKEEAQRIEKQLKGSGKQYKFPE